MKKRILSVLMALCMVLSLAPVTAWAASPVVKVAGIELSDGKCLTDNSSTSATTWNEGDSYVARFEDGVLYLNGLVTTQENSCIYWNSYDNTLTVDVKGENTLIQTVGAAIILDANASNLKIKGDGTLNVTGKTAAIWVKGSIIIEDSVKVTAVGETENGLESNGGILTIADNAQLNVTGKGHGIWTMNGITIKDSSKVTAAGETEGGIATNGGNGTGGKSVNIEDNAVVTTSGAYGILATNNHWVYFNVTDDAKLIAKGTTKALSTRNMNQYIKFDKAAFASTDVNASSKVQYNFNDNGSYKYVEVNPTTYAVSVSGNGNGTATAAPAAASENTVVTLTATPNEGYEFDKWEVISSNVTITDNRFTMPADAVEVKAIFKTIPSEPPAAATYTVSFNSNGGGGNKAAETDVSGTYTLPAANTFTAPEGKEFDGWEVKIGEAVATKLNAGATITVSANTTVKALWKDAPAEPTPTPDPTPTPTPDPTPTPSTGSNNSKPKYTAKVDKDVENGDISFSQTRVRAGRTVTITVTPDTGYALDKLVILDRDGETVNFKDNGNGTFTFTMPSGGVEVEPFFEKIKADEPATEQKDMTMVLYIDQPAYLLNDTPMMNDAAPTIRGERTMLPIRMIAEALGATVAWSEADQTVTIVKDDLEIVVYIGESFALVNGNPVELDSAAFIANDRTYLPLRFVAENLGATVNWDGNANIVTIILK